jgi:phospholipase C
MQGFVETEIAKGGDGAQVLNMYNHTALTVHSALAMDFAVFDKWFASVPGPTEVNRLYVHSGTSHGMSKNNVTEMIDGLPQKSFYTALTEGGVSWKIYYELISTAIALKDMRELRNLGNLKAMHHFFEDAQAGTLPQYSFLEPMYYPVLTTPASDNHPDHNIAVGEQYLASIYEAVRASPQWNETLFIITYDEHGGFYDHVPPPMAGIPNPDGLNGTDPVFGFDRLGVRIPTIMISPWINKGIVMHEGKGPTPTSHYDHTSILATVKKLFNVDSLPLTKRDAWASTFEDVFMQRDTPRTDCPETIPTPPGLFQTLEEFEAEANAPVNDLQKSFLSFISLLTDGMFVDNQDAFQTQRDAGEYVMKQFQMYLRSKLNPQD